ncbi:MAG: hypothetical protein AB1333_01300 [Patescibacteria group bacterium]
MKRLYFSFVLFLFSSLFILSGCYTSFKIQERERTYESVIPDSSDGLSIQDSGNQYDDFQFQSNWHFGYRYPYWYRSVYWYSPWDNLWFGSYWDGYKFGIWNHWYSYPYRYYIPPPFNPGGLRTYRRFDNNWFIPSRIRDNTGERGFNERDRRKEQNPSNVKPKDSEKNPPRGRTDGSRVRSRDEIKKDPPPQVVPPRKDQNTDRQRKEPTRVIPQNNPTREKSSKENPKKSNPTRDRGREK